MLQNYKASLYNWNWNYRPLHAWEKKSTANMNKMFQAQVVVMSTWKSDLTSTLSPTYSSMR